MFNMFKKTTEKNAATAAKAQSTASVGELAQAVRENEARVEQQKKEIRHQIYELEERLKNWTGVKLEGVNTFDLSEIEKNAQPSESRDGIRLKIRAMRDVAGRPAFYDEQMMEALTAYLQAIRPVVAQLEAVEWEKAHQMKVKREEMEQAIRDINVEYEAADHKIKSLLKVAKISPAMVETEKRFQTNRVWGGTTACPIAELIDDALKSCEDRDVLKLLFYANFPHEPVFKL